MLDLPLRWRKPRRVFVNSMSDLFHEKLSNEDIAAVFGVMAACPQHTFQVLTKRAKRMREWLARESVRPFQPLFCMERAKERIPGRRDLQSPGRWPLPNVWLGVSVEDQATADERIPHLLATPAAVRFCSYEPALGPVDFAQVLPERGRAMAFTPDGARSIGVPATGVEHAAIIRRGCRLDQIIVGGESGPGARPFDLAWARSTIAQCRAAGVACFVKQLSARPVETVEVRGDGLRDFGWRRLDDGRWQRTVPLRDRKGGDMAEWPEDLRAREMPLTSPADSG